MKAAQLLQRARLHSLPLQVPQFFTAFHICFHQERRSLECG